jgi:transcriptional regulator with XRE-family HTH domain
MVATTDHVGRLLKRWRTQRRLSQLDLAEAAEVSTRHLSCIERGKARPSQQMVLVLASALDLPLRERNTLLQAAGFAPAYRQTDLSDPANAPVRRALDFLLDRAEPNGVLVMNRRWDLIQANRPFQAMASLALGRPLVPGDNMLALTLRDDGFKPVIGDWAALARGMIHRVHREAVATHDEVLFELLDELDRIDGVDPSWRREPFTETPAAVVMTLSLLGHSLNLFTTMTTMGTPTDVTLQELRIEHYFPADESTETLMHTLLPQLMALRPPEGPR